MAVADDLSRRQFLSAAGALGAGTALFLAGCGSSSKSSSSSSTSGGTGTTATGQAATKDLETVTFQLGWLKLAQFGGHFVALHKGYFAEEGINAVFQAGGTGIDGLTLVESGKVMMADANGSDILTAVSKGIPIKCFGTIYQSTPNALISLQSKPFTTLQSLVGHTVGLPNGEQQLLQAMLAQAGVDPSKVKLVTVGTSPTVLTSGQVDAYIGYGTEQGLDLQQSGVKVNIVYFDQLGDPDYGNAYFALNSTLENKADLVSRWMKADLRGWKDFVADPVSAATLTWNLYHTQTQAVLASEQASSKAAVPLINGGAAATHGLLWVDQQNFTEVYNLYKKAKIITGNVNIADVFTQQFLLSAGGNA